MHQERESESSSEVRRRVSEALAADPRTAGASIEVMAEGSVVTLAGQVDHHGLRDAAEEVAARQRGVIQVVNDLAVTARDEDENLPGVSPMAYRESRPPIIPKAKPEG